MFWFTVACFSRKSVCTSSSSFQNTVNLIFPSEASVLNFFGAGDPLWQHSIHCLLFSDHSDGPKFHHLSLPTIEITSPSSSKWPRISCSFHLISQFSRTHLAWTFQNPRRLMWPTPSLEIPSLRALSFCLIWWFSQIIFSTHFWWESSVAVPGLPEPAVSHKFAFSISSHLNCHTQSLLISTYLAQHSACIQLLT